MLRISKLAAKDYFFEWQISSCFVLGLAAVLAPILILFGLKFGIVGSMVDDLVDDPRNRELRPISSGRYDSTWFSNLKERSDISFVIPRTRNIAANIQLKSTTSPRFQNVEVIPTKAGDPMLPAVVKFPSGFDSIILSKSAAKKLAVKPGDVVDGSVARRYKGQAERVHLKLKIQTIAPPMAFARDGAFSSLKLVEALEYFLDGHAVPELDWSGNEDLSASNYTGFRLFAKTIYDVRPLKEWLHEQGVEVKTRAQDIETVQRLEKNLSSIYWAIAFIGIAGFSLSLGASLWANVDRKRRELSILRLVGFSSAEIILFPMVQSIITAVMGWVLAIVLYYLTSVGINKMMAIESGPEQQVCHLLTQHFVISFGLTCLAATVAACVSGLRAARVEPAEGLKER